MLSGSEQKQSPFEMICSAAIDENEPLLKEAVALAGMNVWSEEHQASPVKFLAIKKNVKAVQFLLRHNASRAFAACGYAVGDHTDEFNELFDEVREKYPEQLMFVIKQGVYGFALSQNPDFFARISREYPDKLKYVQGDLLLGHAHAKNPVKAKEVIADTRRHYSDQLGNVLSAYAKSLARDEDVHELEVFFDELNAEQQSGATGGSSLVKSDMIVSAIMSSMIILANEKAGETLSFFIDLVKKKYSHFYGENCSFVPSEAIGLGAKGITAEAARDFLIRHVRAVDPTGLAPLTHRDYQLYDDIRSFMLMGLAGSGHKATIQAFLRDGMIPEYEMGRPREIFDSICHLFMASTFILGCHYEEAYASFKRGHTHESAYSALEAMIKHCVVEGRLDAAIFFWEKIKSEQPPLTIPSNMVLHYLLECLCKHGYHREAWKMIKKSDTGLDSDWLLIFMARGLGQAGNIKPIEWFLTKVTKPSAQGYMLQLIGIGLISNQHFTALYRLMEKIKTDFPRDYACLLENFILLMEKKNIDRSFLAGAILDETIKGLSSDTVRESGHDRSELKQLANDTYARMIDLNLTCNQVVAWYQPQIQTILLQGSFCRLPAEVTVRIIAFLSIRALITPEEVRNLAFRLQTMRKNKTGFFKSCNMEETKSEAPSTHHEIDCSDTTDAAGYFV